MSDQLGRAWFDACSLSNFAAVDRLDLLDERYGYRASWTETVKFEIQRGVSGSPYLQRVLDARWLGEPVEIGGSVSALREIDNIRRGLGGRSGEPMQHLGEAELIYHLGYVDVSGILVTDDQFALDFAIRRGITAIDTRRVLEECHSQGEIGCPAAFELIKQMHSAGRGVRVPETHMSVCPS